MKKIVMLVILLAIIAAVPAFRERAGVAALPVFAKLGPVGETLARPVHNYSARTTLKFYLRIIGDDATENRPLPEERGFPTWVRSRMKQESGIDPWGNAYWLKRNGRTFTVGSNGADGQRGTGDDVTRTATF